MLNPDRMPTQKAGPTGSLQSGEPAFLAAGKIRRPHGVRGEVLLEVYTDFPERLSANRVVYLGEKHEAFTLLGQRQHKDGLLLAFTGITTPEEAGRFRNQVLYVDAEESPELEEGEYYFHELLDMNVLDESGTLLGTLTEIIETGANDVYVVTTPSEREILLPVIPEVILAVDLDTRRMTVRLLPGLVDGEDA